MATKSKSKKTLVSREGLATTGTEMEIAGTVAAMAGANQMMQGAEEVKLSQDLGDYATVAAAAGASDLTRAADAALVADRVEELGGIVEAAGIIDMAEGIEMLEKGENVRAWGAVVGLMSEADLERGLELARLSGELETISDVIERLQMPVLTEFLDKRGERLQEIAVDVIMRAAGTRALGQAMGKTGKDIQAMGEQEMAEGAVRVAVSDVAKSRSRQLSKESNKLAERGVDTLMSAEIAGEAARMSAAEGAANIAEGAGLMGAGIATDQMGEALEERAKK